MEDGLIPAYAQDVSDSISPLLSRCFQSVSELSDEIISVSKTLTLAAPRHLHLFVITRSSPLSRTQSSVLYANKVGKLGNGGSWPAVLVKVLYMRKNGIQRRRCVDMWPRAVPGKKGQEFRLEIHYSGRTTVPVLILQTPDLSARVSGSAITSVPTHKKL